MKRNWMRFTLMILGMTAVASAHAAVDSYRFAHVTIATPWYIFIFLLMGVFIPFILMAVLAWRVALRKSEGKETEVAQNNSEK